MRIHIVIPVHNRPQYLKRTLDSLHQAKKPKGTTIWIVNDGSTDPLVQEVLDSHQIRFSYLEHPYREGVCKTIMTGMWAALGEADPDEDIYLMNLDSDALVRNDFIQTTLRHLQRHPDHVVTGFHSTTRNRDGSERHRILDTKTGYPDSCFKESVGGIHMAYTPQTYANHVLPILDECARNGGNWDHKLSIRMMDFYTPIVCAVPSVVQHIGIKSAMGHGSGEEKPDTADDFKALGLPQVTLIGADCVSFDRLRAAAQVCIDYVEFGDIKLLTSLPTTDPLAVRIQKLKSHKEYSRFMIKDLADHITTSHALVIQHDGFILNPGAWKDEWLKYDYIGAPWWYEDDQNVGNGGFSLRSKRLQEILATDPNIKLTHPEDHHICRTYRSYLEATYKIRFAPEKVAERFSIEGHNGTKTYSGQFGFHGTHVRSKQVITRREKPKSLIISQFQGIGDILFSMPLVRKWIAEGYQVTWPVIRPYVPLQKHFPDIKFLDMEELPINYNHRGEFDHEGSTVIPLRWAERILGKPYKDVMRAKYDLYGEDWKEWRKVTWMRDSAAEKALLKVLEIRPGEPYNLINRRFRSDQTGRAQFNTIEGIRNIEVHPIEGFTMLDWAKVIEQAASIHTVSTGILYMIDVLETTTDLHQYLRKPDEKDFSFTDYLWAKKYQYHL